MKNKLKIAITGATGNIAYQLLFQLAQGTVWGTDQPITVCLYDLPGLERRMEGIAMEVEDSCFSLLSDIQCTTDLDHAFSGADFVILIGSKPRQSGMERKALLLDNGPIFVEQGAALNRVGHPGMQVLVVGNPCNTNALIAMHHAPLLARHQFHAFMTLDEHRTIAALSRKIGCALHEIMKVIVWGNHSMTQVPDVSHAMVRGLAWQEWLEDPSWMEGPLFDIVRKRGSRVMDCLGRSSAASAAQGILTWLRHISIPTEPGHWFTTALCSDGNSYGWPENIVVGGPHTYRAKEGCALVPELLWRPAVEQAMQQSIQELLEERDLAHTGGFLV